MNKSFEVGVQYSVPTTGKKLDPLTKVPQSVLDKVERHSDRFFHAARKEHLKIETRVIDKRFESVMGQCYLFFCCLL